MTALIAQISASVSLAALRGTGLEVTDLVADSEFYSRLARARNAAIIPEGMRRVAHALIERPDKMLQTLVETAVELTGADSAAVSLEREKPVADAYYRWVAVAGRYSSMYNALFPYYPSACTICLERGRPQQVRARARYFELLGVCGAPPVTDGLMFPWQTEESRGTIYILAHERESAFDPGDLHLMEILADFAAIGVRQIRQQRLLLRQAGMLAEAEMANNLAHNINNPLQGLTNVLYLAAEGHYGDAGRSVAIDALSDLERICSVVKELLSISVREQRVPMRQPETPKKPAAGPAAAGLSDNSACAI